ncbi:MAG: hypothetical protein HGA31_02370 [Candidatus Moranbacteria bacterium]|nr:hypothetical protein [Candidatus Moranbacteria bacterium]
MKGFVFRFAQLFLFLVPLQFALVPFSGVDLPYTRILAPLLFISWLTDGLARRRLKTPLSVTLIGLSVYLSLSFLSIFFAQDQEWAFRRVTFLFSYFPLFPVFSSIMSEYGDYGSKKLLRAFLFGATSIAIVAITQFVSQFIFGVEVIYKYWIESVLPFFLGPGFSGAVSVYPSLLVNLGGRTVLRASAFFPDPHMLAFYMGLALPVSVALFVSDSELRRKIFYFASFLLILSADILSFSRGGYVGLFFGLCTAAVLVIRRMGFSKILLTFAVFFTFAASILIISVPVRERLMSTFSIDDGSNKGRVEMFQEAMAKIWVRPYGYGLGNYPLAVKPTAGYRDPIYAHDLYLDIATEAGILASAAFLFALGSAYFRNLRLRSEVIPLSIAVSIAVFFAHSLFETPLYSVQVLPALLFVLALPDAYGRIET